MRKTSSIQLEVPGHGTFPSIAKCAEYFGVAYTTVYHHMENGTLDQINASGRPKNNCHPITIDGVRYPSRTAAMRTLGYSHQEFYKRLNAGLPLPPKGDYNQANE